MPQAIAATSGRVLSKVFIAVMKPSFDVVRLLAAEQILFGDAAIFEHELRRLVGAEAELLFDLADREAGRALLDDERAMPGAAERRIDGREDRRSRPRARRW